MELISRLYIAAVWRPANWSRWPLEGALIASNLMSQRKIHALATIWTPVLQSLVRKTKRDYFTIVCLGRVLLTNGHVPPNDNMHPGKFFLGGGGVVSSGVLSEGRISALV